MFILRNSEKDLHERSYWYDKHVLHLDNGYMHLSKLSNLTPVHFTLYKLHLHLKKKGLKKKIKVTLNLTTEQ